METLLLKTFKGSLLRTQLSNMAEIQTHPSFYALPKDPIKSEDARVASASYLDFSDAQG